MPKLEIFRENPEAREWHAQGLAQAKHGEFRSAQDSYAEALGVLEEKPGIDDLSVSMQSLRIWRDDGFVDVRRSLQPGADLSGNMSQAYKKLAEARLASQILKDRGRSKYETEAWENLRSEHGATLGVIARMATAMYVLEQDLIMPPMPHYREAYEELSHGNNRYYATSNALNGARQMAIEGNPRTATEVWLRRAVDNVRQARTQDPDNYIAAQKDLVRREKFLKSQRIARSSVFRAP